MGSPEVSEWWLGGQGTRKGQAPADASARSTLACLLGSEGLVEEFGAWLQAASLEALGGQLGLPEQGGAAAAMRQEHMRRDVERYLQMSHDPRLQLHLSAPPTSWVDPRLRATEQEWLDGMRPHLDAYLEALELRPLGDAEWQLYREVALAELGEHRQQHEAELRAQGHSAWFHPKAEEQYLRRVLDERVAHGSPLYGQSRKYLDTILRNPSWTWAQRRQAVKRIVELNDHFRKQPAGAVEQQGSPFAALFAVGGPDLLPKVSKGTALQEPSLPAPPPETFLEGTA